jgi:hypothetical protein
MTIRTIQRLKACLQTAIELEHATIPTYLCGGYSIHPNTNIESYDLIMSVVKEEMLHLTLAANVLNAIGGEPILDKKDFIPNYPTYLPHSNRSFLISLAKFSPESLDVFLKIELPEKNNTPTIDSDYSSIKQFYDAIIEGLKYLVNEYGEDKIFCGDKSKQVGSNHYYYGAGGKDISVYDLRSALSALEVIIEQGEGANHTIFDGDLENFGQHNEKAHYFRFNEIKHGRYYSLGDDPKHVPTGKKFKVDWDKVYNIYPNAKLSDYPKDSEIYKTVKKFNILYTVLLKQLHKAFNGNPDLLQESVCKMFQFKYLALELMKNPFPKDHFFNAAPTFEYDSDAKL